MAVIEGMDKVLLNLHKEVEKIKGRTLSGFVSALLFVRAESQKECPVVEGNLKNSAFVVASTGGVSAGSAPTFKGPHAPDMSAQHQSSINEVSADISKDEISGAVGYSAVYAAAVHENPRAGKTEGVSSKGVKYTAGLTESGKPSKRAVFSTVGKWKFLEDPLKSNTKKILEIIAKKAKIK